MDVEHLLQWISKDVNYLFIIPSRLFDKNKPFILIHIPFCEKIL